MIAVHIAVLVLGLLGFAGLGIGTQRYAPQIMGFLPAPSLRRASWWSGWALLGAAFVLSLFGLQTTGVGGALWFGWLSLAGLMLTFGLPRWPWRRLEAHRGAREPRTMDVGGTTAPVRKPRRWIGLGLLAATLVGFLALLLQVETKPLLRDDVVQGKVGPWAFTLAETDRDPPELVDMDVPRKVYSLRFCSACDLEITRAYLKVNRPRALRVAGMVFEGNVRERRAEIQLPDNLRADSELWLTVVGKDGSTHQVFWPISAISPATVAWFAEQETIR